ncbi:hypothetical protein RhiirA1_480311 [Rhizophagus irregularis]|uniref:Uncharacterized protein n=1 Tax=Rhizophagus irregularis TaxID=588596 RepID=A0A2I1FM99_9GLOM|nr:hypothetical protein RhiirA1_480311 [Rhizophagus irregularis]PKY35482.1 hypothetical protein RhiirB3_456345 [Rhizophagus irregularis]
MVHSSIYSPFDLYHVIPIQQQSQIKLYMLNYLDYQKKVIDSAIKADIYQELSDMFKIFLYKIQTKIDENQQTNEDYIIHVKNPNITKHKGIHQKGCNQILKNSSLK